MEFEVSQITRKLGLISEVMADAYHFMNMRTYVEEWDQMAKAGDPEAQEMIRVIETFHRLCSVIKRP